MVWPNREHTHALLAATRDRLPRDDYEQAWQEGERLSVAQIFGVPEAVDRSGSSDDNPAA